MSFVQLSKTELQTGGWPRRASELERGAVLPLRDNWVYVSNEGPEISTIESRSDAQQETRRDKSVASSTGVYDAAIALPKGISKAYTQKYEVDLDVQCLPSSFDTQLMQDLPSELVSLQNQYKHERRQYSICYQNVNSFLQQLADNVSRCGHGPNMPDSISKIVDRYRDELSRCTEALGDVEARLTLLEESLDKVQRHRSDSQAPQSDQAGRISNPPFNYDLEIATESSDSSSEAPSLLEEYFDKAGEVFVAKERLTELDLEQEALLAQSQCIAAYTNALPSFECSPERSFKGRRMALMEALTTAEEELCCLREACLHQGIEPELVRYRRVSVRNERPAVFSIERAHALARTVGVVKDAINSVATTS